MRKMFAYIMAFGAIALNGCASTNVSETLQDELAREFGSFEIACEARMTIIPSPTIDGLPTELSREDRIEVLNVLRKCIRYVEKSPEAKATPSHRSRRSISVALRLSLESKEKEFSISFLEPGFLIAYLCPTPHSAMEVGRVLNQCILECRRAYNERCESCKSKWKTK